MLSSGSTIITYVYFRYVQNPYYHSHFFFENTVPQVSARQTAFQAVLFTVGVSREEEEA